MLDKIASIMAEHWASAPVILIAGWIVIKILHVVLTKAFKKSSLDPALHKFVCNGVAVLCWVVLLGTLASWLGVPISTFVAVLGAAGAAAALALKDTLGNIVGGFNILVSKPFKNGDFIEVNGVIGEVDQIGLLFSMLRTVDNKVIYIPNGLFSTSIMLNYTASGKRRIDCQFALNYNSDMEKAKELAYAIVEQNPLLLPDPEPMIGVFNLADGCIYFDIKAWCATDDFFPARYSIQENVKLAFDEAGIELVRPQMEVRVKK